MKRERKFARWESLSFFFYFARANVRRGKTHRWPCVKNFTRGNVIISPLSDFTTSLNHDAEFHRKFTTGHEHFGEGGEIAGTNWFPPVRGKREEKTKRVGFSKFIGTNILETHS